MVLLGSLLGSGVLWQVMNYRLESERLTLEKYRMIIELRNQISAIGDPTALRNTSVEAMHRALEARDGGDEEWAKLFERAMDLENQLQGKKATFDDLERKLAGLENREPREFIPKPLKAPTGIRRSAR